MGYRKGSILHDSGCGWSYESSAGVINGSCARVLVKQGLAVAAVAVESGGGVL